MRYRVSEPAHVILYVRGKRRYRSRSQQLAGIARWFGYVNGRGVRAGPYRVTLADPSEIGRVCVYGPICGTCAVYRVIETNRGLLLGTCRMGSDPKTSVINSDHRTHDVKNLFLCDGSSLVTSGRGQPTMTIEALAFRAADRITGLAKGGEIGA